MKATVCSQQFQQCPRLKKQTNKNKRASLKRDIPFKILQTEVAQQAAEKSVGVVKSGRAGPGSQSASQDG